jgi:predicted metal-dependent HD superfamily phosphohydrolase
MKKSVTVLIIGAGPAGIGCAIALKQCAGFLDRPRLYQTDFFYDRSEALARSNLEKLHRSLKV